MIKDMTSGKPARLLLSFSIPLILGNLFQQFYSMADTLIVGRTLGEGSLAAVGSTGSISFLVLGFMNGITGGFAVMPAQRFGAGDEEGVRKSVCSAVRLCLLIGGFLTVVSAFGARPLLELMNTPEDIIEEAWQYIVVIFLGIGAAMFYNMISAVIRALGDSRTPLYFLIVASLLNIVLDFVCILVFHMGVAGAGWATVAAQLVAGFLCLIYVRRRFPILRMRKSDWKFDRFYTVQHLRIGLPMAFQFSVTAIGVMVVQTALNGFGSTTIAAYTAASKIDNFFNQPCAAFGVAMATYAAQNYGAGRLDRLRKGVNSCVWLSIVFSVVGGVLAILGARPLTRLFVENADPIVYDLSETYLIINASMYILLGLLFVYRNVLQGIGKSTMPLLAGGIEVVMRVLAAAFLVGPFGYAGVCASHPIAWLGAALLVMVSYFVILRRMEREREPEAAV